MVARKGRIVAWDAMIGQIGVISHGLQSLLGAIKTTILLVFICGVKYKDVVIKCLDQRDSSVQVGDLTYLPL